MTYPPADEFIVVIPKADGMPDEVAQRLADFLEASIPDTGFTVIRGGRLMNKVEVKPVNVSDDDDIPESERRSLPEPETIAAIMEAITAFIEAGGGGRLN